MEELVSMWGLSDHVAFKDFQVLLVNSGRNLGLECGEEHPRQREQMLKGPEVAIGR